jgi:hypothetical protein
MCVKGKILGTQNSQELPGRPGDCTARKAAETLKCDSFPVSNPAPGKVACTRAFENPNKRLKSAYIVLCTMLA